VQKLNLTVAQVSEIELSKSKIPEQTMFHISKPNLLKEGESVNSFWLKYGDLVAGVEQSMFIKLANNSQAIIYDENGELLPIDEREMVGIYRWLTLPNKTAARK